MPRISIAVAIVFALMIAGGPIRASEPAASSSAPAKKTPSKGAASSAAALSSDAATAAKKNTSATAPPAQQETIEQIVARVQKRLATEVPRGPKPVAARSQPPVTPRVTLEWRPSVVWPAEIGGEAPPAVGADPNRVSLSWHSQ
jgi:hypothetical protein